MKKEIIQLKTQKNQGSSETTMNRGTWVAQLGKHLTSAQVMISQLLSLSTALGSALTAWSLLGILLPSLSATPQLALCIFLKIN